MVKRVGVVFILLTVVFFSLVSMLIFRLENLRVTPLSEMNGLIDSVYDLLTPVVGKTDNVVLDYFEVTELDTNELEFLNWNGRQNRGEIIILNKKFRIYLKYDKYGFKRNKNVKVEDWFDATAYAQIKDDKLMDIGILMINNNTVRTLHREYSDDKEIIMFAIVSLFMISVACAVTLCLIIRKKRFRK